ncbi:MAG: ribonuclease P protein component 4 [Promethearchaeota archaeon]
MPNKKIVKQIARSRIEFLFKSAHEIFLENKNLSNRYASLARRYSQRAKVSIPIHWKKRICHKCKKFLYPGKNCRVRMQSRKGKGSHVSMTCLECNNTTRYFVKIPK